MGRHVEELERDLGVTLFERTLQGLKPTDTALRSTSRLPGAQRALAEAAIMAEGRPQELSRHRAHHLQPGHLPLCAAAPAARPSASAFRSIAIELVPSDSAENLLLREADIAVRMFRPTQLELITRKLGDIPIVADRA